MRMLGVQNATAVDGVVVETLESTIQNATGFWVLGRDPHVTIVAPNCVVDVVVITADKEQPDPLAVTVNAPLLSDT